MMRKKEIANARIVKVEKPGENGLDIKSSEKVSLRRFLSGFRAF
jgi:hypothetical protein